MPEATHAEVLSDDLLARAFGRLRVAVQRLLRHQPLHAALAARADLAADNRAEGLTLRAGRPALVLVFNPTFVQGCSQDELASAIKQACDRLVSRHLDASDEDVDVDDPSIAAVAAEIEGFARAVVGVAIKGAIDALSPDEWAALPAATRDGLIGRAAGGTGTREALDVTGRGRVDWRRVLRRHVRESYDLGYTLARPPRRYPSLVGVVPGVVPRPGRARVLVAIDTSGSMPRETLEQIAAELGRMSRTHEIHVVECDEQITAEYRYAGRLEEVQGRGGTDLRPALEPEFLRRVRPDVVVYFTDGDGPAPARAPKVPVIWCLTPGGAPPAPWGRVVEMAGGAESSAR